MSEEKDNGHRFAVLMLNEVTGDAADRYERNSTLITANEEASDVEAELQRHGYTYAAIYRGNLTLDEACALAADLHRTWIAAELADEDDASEEDA